MTISKDRVKPSPMPDSWKLSEIFATGIVLGSYLALMTVIFFYLAYETSFFAVHLHTSLILLILAISFMMKKNQYSQLNSLLLFIRNILG